MVQNLKTDISMALAWGYPDNECIGYSTTEFMDLLKRAQTRILMLENLCNAYNVHIPGIEYEQERANKLRGDSGDGRVS